MNGLHSNDVGYIGTGSLLYQIGSLILQGALPGTWQASGKTTWALLKLFFSLGKIADFFLSLLSFIPCFHSLFIRNYEVAWVAVSNLSSSSDLLSYSSSSLKKRFMFIPASFLKWSLIYCCLDPSCTFSLCFTYLLRFFWATIFLKFFL